MAIEIGKVHLEKSRQDECMKVNRGQTLFHAAGLYGCIEWLHVVPFNQSSEEPERQLLLADDVENLPGDEAHALAIAHIRMDNGKCAQDVLNLLLRPWSFQLRDFVCPANVPKEIIRNDRTSESPL